jgi:hypothetical protein
MRRYLPIALSILVVLLVAYAISSASTNHAKPAAAKSPPPAQPIAPTTTTTEASPIQTATRQGSTEPTPNTQTGPVVTAAEGSCHWREYRDGAIAPHPGCAPGRIDPSVPGHTAQTVCSSAWVAVGEAVKPPGTTKDKLLIEYSLPGSPLTYVVAQVVPVEDGGSPTSAQNLYPLPLNGYGGQQTRTLVADRLHSEICSHKITVAQAAKMLASDWLAKGIPNHD